MMIIFNKISINKSILKKIFKKQLNKFKQTTKIIPIKNKFNNKRITPKY